jgi:hypothetical protein
MFQFHAAKPSLSEACRRMVRQVQGHLQHPLSHRMPSGSHQSEIAGSLGTSPRHGSCMAPPTPFDGVHTARHPMMDGNTTDYMHEAHMQRCESAPLPHSYHVHSSSTGGVDHFLSTSSQACDTDSPHHQQHPQHDQQHSHTVLHSGTQGPARLTVHVPRGRLASLTGTTEDACRRSTSLPPARGDARRGDASPLCHAVSALHAGGSCAAAHARQDVRFILLCCALTIDFADSSIPIAHTFMQPFLRLSQLNVRICVFFRLLRRGGVWNARRCNSVSASLRSS